MSKEPEQEFSRVREENANGPPEGFGKGVNEYLSHYVRNADAKAGVLVAANLTIGAFLLAHQPTGFCASIVHWLAIGLLVLSALFGGLVVYPRTPSSGDGLIFWEDILSRRGPEQYQEELKGLDQKKVEGEYAIQNYYVSQVLRKKHNWIRWCLRCFFVAVACAALSIGISS